MDKKDEDSQFYDTPYGRFLYKLGKMEGQFYSLSMYIVHCVMNMLVSSKTETFIGLKVIKK